MHRHDVAIYSPGAACLYERRPEVTGGSERQATLLAGGLVRAGLRVAQIVLPVSEPSPTLSDSLTLVQRQLVSTARGPVSRSIQLGRVWSALAEADAEVYIFRHSLAALGVAGAFCRARRRRLVFSSSNDHDFTFDVYASRRPERELYKFGIRSASAVVVQTGKQAELARRAFPQLGRVYELPSFAEGANDSAGPPEAFLWVGRLDHYKQPLRFVELAEALPEARFWMVVRELDPERSGGSPSGGRDEELEREVQRRAAMLSNLEVLPQRPHREAMRLVERAVAVVNTGAAEGMPNLFLEAWARGAPVLSYEFDPDRRIVEQRLGLAAEGSAERFHEGARQLWRDRDARVELSERVRSYVESTHGVEHVTGRWTELLADVRAG